MAREPSLTRNSHSLSKLMTTPTNIIQLIIKHLLLTQHAFKEARIGFFDTYYKLIPCYQWRELIHIPTNYYFLRLIILNKLTCKVIKAINLLQLIVQYKL
ncbi:hypothetical protein V8B97DRAFT_1993672, partial [Scleroderma yunnanense]